MASAWLASQIDLTQEQLLQAGGAAAICYVCVHALNGCAPTRGVRARVLAGAILGGMACCFAAYAVSAAVPLTTLPGYGIVNIVMALPMFMLLPFAQLSDAPSTGATGTACIILGATCVLHSLWLCTLLLGRGVDGVEGALAVLAGLMFDSAIVAHLALLQLESGPMQACAHAVDALLYACCVRGVRVEGEDVLIRTPAGIVRVRTILPPGITPSREAPTVLVIPDGPAFVEHAQEACVLLATTLQLRVIAMDMPGFGLSRAAATYGHSFSEGAAVLLHIMDAMHVQSAVIHASCVNGFYAIAAASAAPHRVTGLVLAQTPSVPAMRAWAGRIIPFPVKLPFLGQVLSFAMRRSLVARWFRIALPRDREGAADRVRRWTAQGEMVVDVGGCNCLAGVVQGTLECDTAVLVLTGAAAQIPVELVWGAADVSHKGRTLPSSLLELLPHARLRVLEAPAFQAGHAPTLEYPNALVDAVRAIMARQPEVLQQEPVVTSCASASAAAAGGLRGE